MCLVCLLLCKEEGSGPVSLQLLRGGSGPVCGALVYIFIGMGTMLAYFHMCGITLLLRSVFNMLVWNASPREPMCFRCLMFSLSGPELR